MAKSVYSRESKILAEFLANARKRAGLLQAEVAQKMSNDQTIISKIESGQRRIDVVEFHDYAKAIGHDPAEFFGDLIKEWRSAS